MFLLHFCRTMCNVVKLRACIRTYRILMKSAKSLLPLGSKTDLSISNYSFFQRITNGKSRHEGYFFCICSVSIPMNTNRQRLCKSYQLSHVCVSSHHHQCVSLSKLLLLLCLGLSFIFACKGNPNKIDACPKRALPEYPFPPRIFVK